MPNWPVIRNVGLLDIVVSLVRIGHLAAQGSFPNDNKINKAATERIYVFYLLSHFLLILRLCSALVLVGASFKGEFRKQFNACVMWCLVSLMTLVIASVQFCVSILSRTEMIICIAEILFRLVCSFFVIRYMKNEDVEVL